MQHQPFIFSKVPPTGLDRAAFLDSVPLHY